MTSKEASYRHDEVIRKTNLESYPSEKSDVGLYFSKFGSLLGLYFAKIWVSIGSLFSGRGSLFKSGCTATDWGWARGHIEGAEHYVTSMLFNSPSGTCNTRALRSCTNMLQHFPPLTANLRPY